MDQLQRQCAALAADIRQAREQILSAWRERVAQDPGLTTSSSISRAQFTDSIPKVLDAFELALTAEGSWRETEAQFAQWQGASEHGLHRWQQGYDLRETMREWAHLHQCILAYLERYTRTHQELEPRVLERARAALVRLCGEGACESAARYTRLQQAEAAGRVRDLELAVEELRALEKNRLELLRHAAHDLRGSVSVISNASVVLGRSDSEEMRGVFYAMLERAVHSTSSMLTDLLDLTRLEAGQERVEIKSFDVSALLRGIGDSLRPQAALRGLFLKVDGPDELQVAGDAGKVRRIVQNLVLNALKVTAAGGVTLGWAAPSTSADPRWTLIVQDTGPGFTGSHATPLTDAIEAATEQAQHQPSNIAHSPASESNTAGCGTPVESGEGIGLSIVKRLCELLGAAIELESSPSRGTLFRLRFPVHSPLTPSSSPEP